MAVRIQEYQQQTVPNNLGPSPRARGIQVDDSMARAGMQLGQALQTTAGVFAQIDAQKKREEEEDAKVWTASTLAQAQAAQMAKFAEMQDQAGDGAPEFTQKFNDQFTKYEEDTLANAPNETSKKFLREGLTRLRMSMTGDAIQYQTAERRSWRYKTGKEAIDATAATMARDPSRIGVSLAEQRAMIDSYDISPDQKRNLKEYLDETVSTAAVLGEAERNPAVAQKKLAARLGIDHTQVVGATGSADVVWSRMIKQESGGHQTGKGGAPLTSNKGAIGIAQILPETGPEAARYASLPWDEGRFRNDADYNAALGRAYFDEMNRRYKSPALAAAAYNAGPGAVNDWIEKYGDPRKGEISVAEFAAKIPYKETREYVAAVAAPGSGTIGDAMTMADQKPAGLVEAGNIDLGARPVVKNADGSISTVRSMSFEEDGREVLVPTVSDDGRILSDDEAIALYRKTGHHLGKFENADQATAYAQTLHKQQEGAYAGPQQTGDIAYDLLPVPKVVQLLGQVDAELNKQQAQFRSFVATREQDDLAAFGDGKQPPQPLSAGEFIGAYGEVEGMQRWTRYQTAQQYSTELSGLATKTPEEIAATVKAREPQAGPGYASSAPMHATLVRAANATLQARHDDPIAFAMSSGLTDQKPLDMSNAQAFTAGLSARVGLAQTMSQKYQTPYSLLTKGEATALSATMTGMTSPEKVQFLGSIRGALPNARAYQSIMTSIRPDSPVTAIAGSILVQQNPVQVQATGWFSRGQAMAPDQVAMRIIEGEDILNPAKADAKSDGKPKLPMPNESDLRAQWLDVVGDAYRGSAQTEADSYQAYRAFYAAEVARRGKYDGALDTGVAQLAAKAVTGGVADVNGAKTVMPWGMPETDFLDRAREQWDAVARANGLADPFDSVQLQAVANGRYAVVQGLDVVRGKGGAPLFLNVNLSTQARAPQPEPAQPAAPAALGSLVPGLGPNISIGGGQ